VNNPDHKYFPELKKTIFEVKILKLFDADPESVMKNTLVRDPDPRSQIRNTAKNQNFLFKTSSTGTGIS
jgi:hypothetical protein